MDIEDVMASEIVESAISRARIPFEKNGHIVEDVLLKICIDVSSSHKKVHFADPLHSFVYYDPVDDIDSASLNDTLPIEGDYNEIIEPEFCVDPTDQNVPDTLHCFSNQPWMDDDIEMYTAKDVFETSIEKHSLEDAEEKTSKRMCLETYEEFVTCLRKRAFSDSQPLTSDVVIRSPLRKKLRIQAPMRRSQMQWLTFKDMFEYLKYHVFSVALQLAAKYIAGGSRLYHLDKRSSVLSEPFEDDCEKEKSVTLDYNDVEPISLRLAKEILAKDLSHMDRVPIKHEASKNDFPDKTSYEKYLYDIGNKTLPMLFSPSAGFDLGEEISPACSRPLEDDVHHLFLPEGSSDEEDSETMELLRSHLTETLETYSPTQRCDAEHVSDTNRSPPCKRSRVSRVLIESSEQFVPDGETSAMDVSASLYISPSGKLHSPTLFTDRLLNISDIMVDLTRSNATNPPAKRRICFDRISENNRSEVPDVDVMTDERKLKEGALPGENINKTSPVMLSSKIRYLWKDTSADAGDHVVPFSHEPFINGGQRYKTPQRVRLGLSKRVVSSHLHQYTR